MYVSPWLQSLLLPRKWDVAGVIAKPLSLWHVYILKAAGNPYLCGGEHTPDAAAEVLMYASGDVAHGRRLYTDAMYRARTRKRIVRSIMRAKWDRSDAAVNEYVFECTRTPGHKRNSSKQEGSKTKSVAAPTEFVIAEFMVGRGAADIESALDLQYSLACCVFDAHRDANGEDESLISEVDEERTDKKLDAMEGDA